MQQRRADEVIGQSLHQLLPTDLMTLYHQQIQSQNLLEDAPHPASHQLTGRRKDGTLFPAEASISQLDLEGERIFTVFLRDVTDRQRAEAALQASEERWQLAIAGTNDGIWDWNIQTNEIFWSTQWKQILGYEDHEISGSFDAWVAHVHPDDFDRVMQAHHDHLNRLTPRYTAEYRMRCKDSSYKWILARGLAIWDAQGNPVRMLGSHTDISDRKRAEEALRRYERIVSASTDGICLINRNYTYQLVNQAYLNWHQLSSDAIIGHTISDILGIDLFETQIKPRLDRCFAGETIQNQLWVDYPTGRKFISVTYGPYYDANQTISGVVASLRNLTDLKQAEDALQRSEKRLQLALEASGDGLWDWNIETNHVYYSPRYFEMLGYTKEEYPHRFEIWKTLIHPDDQPWVFERLQAHLNDSSIPYDFDYRLRMKSGEWKWISNYGKVVARDAQGHPLRMTGTHRDASNRKIAEQALKASEERYRAIVEDQTELICRFLPDSTILFVNDAYCRYFGLQREALIGKTYQPVIYAEDQAKVAELVQSISLDNPNVLIENRVVVNGQIRWTQWSNRLIKDEQGQLLEYQSVGRDITDRKLAEIELQRAKEAAEAASRAKSIFLANMSHELRTPLNIILGFTQVLHRDNSLSPEQHDIIQTIHRSGEHLLGLINDILDLSKIEAERMVLEVNSFDLMALVQSLETMLMDRATSKGVQLTIDLAPDVPQYIRTDDSKLRQILLNLLSNAIKFTEHGQVTLRVSRVQQSASEATVETTPAIAHDESLVLQFDVIDTGLGIAADELNEIFDAFVQSRSGKGMAGGTGLGLTISRHFAQLMGGDISANSVLGQGSTFCVRLPVQSAPISTVAHPAPRRRMIGLAPGQPSYRILVVDDQAENRLLLTKLMSQLGMAVREATNGEEAIALYQHWQPHLIWMDIRMPVLDGYEATRRIHTLATDQQPVIIALTAYASVSDRELALASGCTDFVSKPFDENLLYDKMAEYLNLQFIYAEPEPGDPLRSRSSQKPASPLTPQDLAVMPIEWVQALHQATQECDEEAVQQLIQDIPPERSRLATQLKQLTHSYQFGKIKELTQALIKA